MVISKIVYEGSLRTRAMHIRSKGIIVTDAPLDNHGLGEAFSPTDQLATALASCMITVMGIRANESGWELSGLNAEVTKMMLNNPRRIGKVTVWLNMPSHLKSVQREILEKVALNCPVALSLSEVLEQDVQFRYDE